MKEINITQETHNKLGIEELKLSDFENNCKKINSPTYTKNKINYYSTNRRILFTDLNNFNDYSMKNIVEKNLKNYKYVYRIFKSVMDLWSVKNGVIYSNLKVAIHIQGF